MLKIVPIIPKIMPEFAHYAPTMPTAPYCKRRKAGREAWERG